MFKQKEHCLRCPESSSFWWGCSGVRSSGLTLSHRMCWPLWNTPAVVLRAENDGSINNKTTVRTMWLSSQDLQPKNQETERGFQNQGEESLNLEIFLILVLFSLVERKRGGREVVWAVIVTRQVVLKGKLPAQVLENLAGAAQPSTHTALEANFGSMVPVRHGVNQWNDEQSFQSSSLSWHRSTCVNCKL